MRPQDLDELLRFERGELAPSRSEAWRARLDSDAEAREWLAWAQGLRKGVGPGSGSGEGGAPDPMDVAALAQGILDGEQAHEVRAQLADCPDGMGMLAAALEEVAAQGIGAGEVGRADGAAVERRDRPEAQSHAWRRVLLLAAGLLVLTWGGRALWLGGSEGAGSSGANWAALAERSVLPVATLRSGAGQALELYGQGRWKEAAAGLEARVAAEATDGPAWLYLGSARLLAGEDASGLAALEQAAQHCRGSYAPEAQWLLAQARLIAGDGPGARALLEELSGTRRESAARQLLERMDAVESP